jgi:UDP-4-amino-4,6-dideoxy-N-acetyl-beta-L-altrosamine N-acetyltransferase
LMYNQRVIKLHQSFGFRSEGIFRDHVFIDGTYVSAVRLAILARRWHERAAQMGAPLND